MHLTRLKYSLLLFIIKCCLQFIEPAADRSHEVSDHGSRSARMFQI